MAQRRSSCRSFSISPSLEGKKPRLHRLNSVEPDGRVCVGGGDVEASENHLVYIGPSRDLRIEENRLVTFRKFPDLDITKFWDLASAGFHFTGGNNVTKCFSCGSHVENWSMTDNPYDRRWHEGTCEMISGSYKENVPAKYPRKEARKKFDEWKRTTAHGKIQGRWVTMLMPLEESNLCNNDSDTIAREQDNQSGRFAILTAAPNNLGQADEVSEDTQAGELSSRLQANKTRGPRKRSQSEP